MEREFVLKYKEFRDTGDLDQDYVDLVLAAKVGMLSSYAPYSGFKVGAALQLQNGKILTGANMENAAYPLCICAEQVVLAKANAEFPGIPVKRLAVYAENLKQNMDEPVPPCGACRQVIAEFEQRYQQPIEILLQGAKGKIYLFESSYMLLPFQFDAKYLK